MLSRISQIVFAALWCAATVGYAANVRVTARPNPDGVYSEAFKCVATDHSDCAPPTTGTLTCDDSAAPSLNGLFAGSSFSYDWRQFCAGSAAATATPSVESTSGDDAAAKGWVFSGSNLTNSASNPGSVGSGSLRTCFTASGNKVCNLPRSWSISVATATDTLAPSIPTNLVGTPATNSIVWTWDPSTDQHDGTNNGSGVKEYDLDLNGVTQVVSDPTPGLVTASAEYIIGSPTGTNTTSQSGKQWTITCAGTGIDSTSDQLCLRGWAVSGDFRASVKVTPPGTNNGTQFSPQGLIARGSSAVDAQYVAQYQWSVAQSQASQGKSRAVIGGAKTNRATCSGDNTARWESIQRVGDQWTLSASADGVSYTTCDQFTLALPASLIVGPFVTSMSAGNSNTATFDEFTLSTRAQLSYTQSTTTASRVAKVRARDLKTPTPNVSSYSATVTASPVVSAVPAIKWHPGYYGIVTPDATGTASVTARNTQIDVMCAASGIAGIKVRYLWGALEPTLGNYNFAAITNDLNRIKGCGKRLIAQIQYVYFTSFTSAPTSCNASCAARLPPYLTGGSYGSGTMGGLWPSASGDRIVPKVWNAAVLARLDALWQQIATAYDNDAYFEMVMNPETSMPIANNETNSDYTKSGYAAKLRQHYTNAKTYFAKTNVGGFTNSLTTELQGIIDHNANIGAVVGGPDTIPATPPSPSGARIIAGYEAEAPFSITDYRGRVPIQFDIQSPELGGKEGDFTAAQLITQANSLLKATHESIIYLPSNPNGQTDWTDFISYIATHPLTTTTCPTAYTQGCDTN